MWIFIFVLAMVPMAYYWSDSVTTMFPQLAQYLPDKGDKKTTDQAGKPPVANQALQPTKWAQANTDAGFAIWLMSADGQYRVAAGCRKNEPPTVRVSQLNGKPVPESLVLDFQYGRMPLTQGIFVGSATDLMNAVSQFGTVSLQLPQTAAQAQAKQPGQAIAWFKVDTRESGLMARGLQQYCSYTK